MASAVLLVTLNNFGLIVKPSANYITYTFHQKEKVLFGFNSWSSLFPGANVLIFFVHLNNACLTTNISIRSQRGRNAKIYDKKNPISRSIARIDEKTFKIALYFKKNMNIILNIMISIE